MKKIKTLLLILLLSLLPVFSFAAPTDYWVDNNGVVHSYGLITQGFQLGTSTTAGWVMTTDASGVGTWQVGSGGGGMVYPGAGIALSTGSAWSTSITPAALTRTNDTNITLTLGGTPNTALLQGTSLTLGWTGTLADGRIASASTWNAKESALTFQYSLSRSTNTINLVNDSASPGNSYYYGTNSSGTKGFFVLPSGGGMVYPGVGIALSTGSAWDTSISNNSSNWNAAYSHKTTEDALSGLVFISGGSYSSKVIGTDVQAYNASLAAIAGGTWTGATSITTFGTIVTGTVPWANVSKTSSSLADLATRSAGDLSTGSLAEARGGFGSDVSGISAGLLKKTATNTYTSLADPLNAAHGGTGIANNAANTITFSGAYGLTFTLTNTTSITFPTSGTLAILGANTFTGAQTLKVGAIGSGAAPLYFQSGTNLTTPAAGAMEFDGTSFYLTPTTLRKTIAFLDSNITGTAANLSGTQTANYVYASPNGSSGTASFRALVVADIPAGGGMVYPGSGLPLSTGSAWASSLVAVQGKILIGNATPVWSVSTFTIAATPTANKALIGDGTNYILSTPTVPFASSPTAGKIMIGDGTNWLASTPTYPNASPAAGKILIGDGTNFISSTPTYPNVSPAAGKILIGDGTNFIASTPTYPNASATIRKILVSDGTNFVASTETYAVPGTSGNFMKSDGTNWTSSAVGPSSPGGSNLYVQFNNSGAFGGNAAFQFDPTGQTVWIEGTKAITTTASWVAFASVPVLTGGPQGSGFQADGVFSRMVAPSGQKTFMMAYEAQVSPGGEQAPGDNDIYDVNGFFAVNTGTHWAQCGLGMGATGTMTNGGNNPRLYPWVTGIEIGNSQSGIFFTGPVHSSYSADVGIEMSTGATFYNNQAIKLAANMCIYWGSSYLCSDGTSLKWNGTAITVP